MLLATGRCVIAADKQSELWSHAVVETKAGRVERGRIGEAGEELPGPFAGQVLARGGKWVSLEKRKDDGARGAVSRRLISRVGAGDEVDLGLRHAQAKPFVRNEEEKLVAQDGTADHASKVVLFLCQARQAFVVVVPGVSVEDIVAQILECGSMELVGSAAGNDGELRARRTAVLGVERVRLDLVLLHVVDRHKIVVAAVVAGGLLGPGAGRAQIDIAALGNAHVGANAVDREVVRVGALAVDTELACVRVEGLGGDVARSERDERLEAAAAERHILDELAVDRGCQRCGRIDLPGLSIHCHGLTGGAHGETDVLRQSVLRVQFEIGNLAVLESRSCDNDFVMAGPQAGKGVFAVRSGLGCARDVGAEVGDGDGSAGDDCAGRIRDEAGDATGFILRSEWY